MYGTGRAIRVVVVRKYINPPLPFPSGALTFYPHFLLKIIKFFISEKKS